ncbi:NAD-dependent glycerol-3-phosphate dehydrogenase N-terminus-domain-containing protein [Blyttiomyces helicus]|uniref:Glycerol-3-phosphate dehydrogenase [NAD(+)] n=1 Tax=Blyttiomyces helicus TaxID=388810 RepID=A0A4P9WD06_9FUNG|nr:NAD-dependent glycerol-3-phosphate dehydrogenase N-terminus-domain-containing protein [Blyttiomyces helicus]|eukprot:RKO90404.1 NAD-dependent glycerol-3-phosphate dehydrogenase N-terminus-domain-containing protein [Blyttiomyces helicus]
MSAPTVEKVALIGSGNWGSAIAKIVGRNVKLNHGFDTEVRMWVHEEIIQGQKLTDIINTKHENTKYLPGIKLPENVVAVPDLLEAIKGATLLVFVIPHQFVPDTCDRLRGKVHPSARAISLIKGVDTSKGGINLISESIREHLGVDVSVLMGANIATEVALEQFCETTVVQSHTHYPASTPSWALTSATPQLSKKVITTCFGGRNRRVAEAHVLTGKPFDVLEKELLNGQKLQGTLTALEIHHILKKKNLVNEFPFFTTVYQICYEGHNPKSIVEDI